MRARIELNPTQIVESFIAKTKVPSRLTSAPAAAGASSVSSTSSLMLPGFAAR